MIKVFLVEDEIVVRSGIKNKIDWESFGCSIVGDAGDGEMAYPMIIRAQPDIIVTDIKMPFMDGLTLSRIVREQLPGVKIIILSGYDEFEYAQEAIQIGITDYLIKPITKDKLADALKKAVADIEAERAQQADLEQYKKDMTEMFMLKKQALFSAILNGSMSVQDMIQSGKQAGLDILAGAYAIFIFSFRRKDFSDEAYHKSSAQVQEQITRLADDKPDIILFSQSPVGMNFLVKGEDEKSVELSTKSYLERLVSIVGAYDWLCCFAGVGSVARRLSELPRSFDEAARAHSYRYILEPNQVIYADDMDKTALGQPALLENAGRVIIENINRTAIESFLRIGSSDEAERFLRDYCENIGEDCLQSALIRQYIGMDVYCCSKQFLVSLSCQLEEIEAICGAFDGLPTALTDGATAQSYLTRVLSGAIAYRENAAMQKYQTSMHKARQYIEENYGSPDISLNSVAAHVNISASHFSTIFSQENGRTFTEYLTNIRIEKAKELLRCTRRMTSEIGYMVGYKDSHYFSYVFKKAVGCTPSEYRSRKDGKA